jgi:cobalt-zinc-cadmium efflux system membrane fusion protein
MLFRCLITLCAVLLVTEGCRPAPEPTSEKTNSEASGVISLTPDIRAAIELETALVSEKRLPLTLDALGDVTARPEALAVVHAPFEGVLDEIRVRVGDTISRGQTLAVIRSAELGRAQAAFLKALSEKRLAADEQKRQQQLFDANLASRRELDEANQRNQAFEIALGQAREELRIYGLSDRAISKLGESGRVDPLHPLKSPVAGTITQRKALRGDRVAPSDTEPLFSLANLAVVRIETDIPERNWNTVKKGQEARVTVDAMPDKPLQGRVVRIAPILSVATHTGQASIDVPNDAGHLRPGMSARVQLILGTQNVLAVPTSALQHEGERTFVFTALPDETFKTTEVSAGLPSGGWVPITRGLHTGDRVVTRGAFDLLSEAHKASFGGD